MAYKGRTEFNDNKNLLIFLILITVVVFSIAIWAPVSNDEKWLKIVCWLIGVLNIIGIFDAILTFVRLEKDEIVYRKNFRFHKIAKREIANISREKGCPVIISLKNGRKIEIPEVGPDGIEKSIRVWMRSND